MITHIPYIIHKLCVVGDLMMHYASFWPDGDQTRHIRWPLHILWKAFTAKWSISSFSLSGFSPHHPAVELTFNTVGYVLWVSSHWQIHTLASAALWPILYKPCFRKEDYLISYFSDLPCSILSPESVACFLLFSKPTKPPNLVVG